ncbi:phosphate ABC transporter permease subunit PstC [Ktedonosporobacter rubrisoli]|uniref:Phosphate transport system permease protein n=1 Tax=Ktedonosporobacter rubrisoli TaxID=2509675 RepID=A0A4P6JWE5_KTERU|nr:phosphate ABC transporter permease subunit PstC [Ktedonosporobacter rubrisoli]QBD80017.1 phosphate ABC transporter permease subunit PstC [Ktedonosporobacter rubrisoli]
MQRAQQTHLSDQVARIIFLACAIFLVLIIISVFYFVGSKAFLVFFERGGTTFKEFFTSTHWDPTAGNSDTPQYGALGLIVGSVIITFVSVIIATPLAWGMALFMVEVTPSWLSRILQPLIEIFTGMPSVILGFLGLVILVPFLGKITNTNGYGYAAAIIVLVVMILPTITSISIDSLRAVPHSVREASLALGSTRWQMMRSALIPAAASGLATAVVLGMARAIGETLAVAMVLGGDSIPAKLFSLQSFFIPTTNITRAILFDFGETSGVSQDAYWTLAFLLLVISFIFICISRYLASRSVYR